MAQHGTVVFAHHQTRGRGQRKKQWESESKKNIAVSIVVQPQVLMLSQSFFLSMAIAVGTQRFFNSYAAGETTIKWPNDIYWRDRKAAGILIENIIQGTEWKWSVVGVGVNVNQTRFENVTTKAASLKQITGKEFEPLQLAKELCSFLQTAYHELTTCRQELIAAYRNSLYKLNEVVMFKKDSRIFSAVVKGVTDSGHLVLKSSFEETFEVGEIEWVI